LPQLATKLLKISIGIDLPRAFSISKSTTFLSGLTLHAP
jgi:hypothetical protein